MRRMREFLKYYFFDGVDGYATKDCGEYVLEHRWNGNAEKWEVAIFTRQSFNNMKVGQQKHDEFQAQDKHIRDITSQLV